MSAERTVAKNAAWLVLQPLVMNVLSLAADGALVYESTYPDFQNGGGPITTKATYKKP